MERRNYKLGFKKMACELLEKYNDSPIRVSKELGIPIKTYEKWISNFKKNSHCYDEKIVDYEKENKLLKKELEGQRQVVEMLKKAYAFFTEKEPLLQNSL